MGISMFKRIFVEESIRDQEKVKQILRYFKRSSVTTISKVEDIFGVVNKPYLQKRFNRNLLIGVKKGKLLRDSPDAYGPANGPHFCIAHAYNCIYECVYCYLQGYFTSPDLVWFINHQDFIQEIERVTLSLPENETPWFHAGEYVDSLALTHISGELPLFFELFKRLPQARLELRTKSVNIKTLLKLDPVPSVITSFTLSPQLWIDHYESKTPRLASRIKAMKALYEHGHKIAFHLDPIIYEEHFESAYRELLEQICKTLSPTSFDYVSLGALRFSRQVFAQIKHNYPNSRLLAAEFIKGFDKKVRYNHPTRMGLLKKVKELCLNAGITEDKIYLCMEE